MTIHPAIEAAEGIAECLLFPTAMEVDASERVPRSRLEMLADAGLFGLAGPGGTDLPTLCAVVERLASGCLSTAFVWIQHNTPVRELTGSANAALRAEWLPKLCSGAQLAGIALGGLQAGSAGLTAKPTEAGWLISGRAPYVTGWGLIDVLLAASMTPDGRVLRSLIDAEESATVIASPLRLIATNASATVSLEFDRHFVPAERVTSLEPYSAPAAYDGGGRPNGSLALGVARRCLQLIGPTPLDAELDARRRHLDDASDEDMAEARAATAAFAVKAATTLIVSQGSHSIHVNNHAQRLYREAAFLLVFGTRPAIRSLLLRRFGAS
jgi:alkylation response protein AidB-like acyl-CoA dehydrogenase